MSLDLPEPVLAEIRRAQSLAASGNAEGASDAYRALLDQVNGDAMQAVAVLHMWAVMVDDPQEKLALNEDALRRADAAPDFPPPLRASLFGNLGFSHRELGDDEAARSWYLEAKVAAAGLPDDDYGRMVRQGIDAQLDLLSSGDRTPPETQRD